MSNFAEREKFKRAALTVALVTNFVNPFAGTALNVAVPVIGTEFHASATDLGWIVSIYLFVTVAFSIPFGRIADIKGRRPVLIGGIAIFTAASFLAGLAASMPLFIVFRALQGFGAAMIFSTNIPILLEVYPASERGRIIGISIAAVYLGGSLGPVVGGLVTERFGWHFVMYLIAVIALFSLINALWSAPAKTLRTVREAEKTEAAGKPPEDTGPAASKAQGFGAPSILLFIGAMALVMYGFTVFGQNVYSYFILAAGVILGFIFVKHELRAPSPIIEPRLFHNANFLLSNTAALFNYAATFAVGYLMAIYLQLVKGYPGDITGLVLISQPLMQMIISPIAGRLSDRISPFKLASLGMGICACALLCFVFITAETPVYFIVGILLLIGFGFGFFSSPNSNAIMGSVEPRDFSVASSFQSTARTFGQVVGMAVITIVTSFVIGHTAINEVAPDRIVLNIHRLFTIFAIVCAAGIVISLQRRKTAPGQGAAAVHPLEE